jgi:hypothetical protein
MKRVLEYILDIIYDDTEKLFSKTTKTVKILKEVLTREVLVPPREDLENFLMAILTIFSIFDAFNGFFRQTNGVSMEGEYPLR